MTFAQFKVRLARGVMRDDLLASYGDFTNEALQEIQQARSWTCMKKTATVTLPAGPGNETIALPADFKELQRRPAVHAIGDDGSFIPTDTVFEAQQIQRAYAFGGIPIMTCPIRNFLEVNTAGSVVGMVEPQTDVINYRVKYFAWLPPLVADGDTSPFITSNMAMVLAKAKMIAFSDVNDPEADRQQGIYMEALASAIRADAYSEVAGRELHM